MVMTAFKRWLTGVSRPTRDAKPESTKESVRAAVERDCNSALNLNTIEALEEFFQKYPPEKYRDTTPSYALVVKALNDYGESPTVCGPAVSTEISTGVLRGAATQSPVRPTHPAENIPNEVDRRRDLG